MLERSQVETMDVGRLAYSVEDAAVAVGIPKSTLYALVKEGKLRATRIVSGPAFFTRDCPSRYSR